MSQRMPPANRSHDHGSDEDRYREHRRREIADPGSGHGEDGHPEEDDEALHDCDSSPQPEDGSRQRSHPAILPTNPAGRVVVAVAVVVGCLDSRVVSRALPPLDHRGSHVER